MPPDPNIVLIGHSHVNCILAGAREAGSLATLKAVNLRRMDTDTLDAAGIFEALDGFVPDMLCLCIGGNFHNIIGLLEHPRPFSVGVPDRGSIPALGSDRQFIPSALMRALFLQKARADLTEQLFAMFPGAQRVMLNPPPPVADFDHIKDHPGAFADRIAQGAAPAELRLALYALQTDAYRTLARQHGAIFVEPPAQVVDAQGFLAPDFVNDDPTHGNAAYGAVMLAEIRDVMRVPA